VSGSYLLDANALIALVIADHEHHRRVTAWITQVDRFALCPITEGAMVRYLVRAGETPATASTLLTALRDSPTVEFWPDSISYTDAALAHVTGHRHVTDAYLASLAASHQSRLATLDQALATALAETVELIA
jgi:toxin-antitoxin system PIN domain toxin